MGVRLLEILQISECPLDAKMGRILLSQDFLDLRLVVIAIVYDLKSHSVTPF